MCQHAQLSLAQQTAWALHQMKTWCRVGASVAWGLRASSQLLRQLLHLSRQIVLPCCVRHFQTQMAFLVLHHWILMEAAVAAVKLATVEVFHRSSVRRSQHQHAPMLFAPCTAPGLALWTAARVRMAQWASSSPLAILRSTTTMAIQPAHLLRALRTVMAATYLPAAPANLDTAEQ